MSPSPHPTAPTDPPVVAAAAAAVWDWRRGEQPPDPRPGTASRRKRAAVQALVGAAVGGLVYLRSPTMAMVVWALAAAGLLLALLSPDRGHAALERALAWFGRAVGRGLAVVLLVPLFVLFFLPFGLLARRGRRDRLERFFDPEAATYWKRREPAAPTLADYERMS
jgi:hypothetical protein